MNVLKYNEGLKSYKYPIIKLLICLALIAIFIFRGHIIHIDNRVADIIVTVCCTVLGVICIYCVYISVIEILQVHENKMAASAALNYNAAESRDLSIEEIVKLAETNDIIEILIITNGESITVGSSSDCKQGSSRFFDKEYYIGKETFPGIPEFKEALMPYSSDGKLSVILIDGLKPKHWKI